MEPLDIDQLFVEQDRIMAMPDEDLNIYFQRIALQRPSGRSYWGDVSHENLPGSSSGVLAAPHSQDISKTIATQNAPAKASVVDIEMHSSESDRGSSSTSGTSKEMALQYGSEKPQCTDRPQAQASLVVDPQNDATDALVIDHCQSPSPATGTSEAQGKSGDTSGSSYSVSPPSSPSPPSPQKRKSHVEAASYPNKKRLILPSIAAGVPCNAASEPSSPISSFSKTSQVAKRTSRIVVDQEPQPLPLLPVAQGNAVDQLMRAKGTRAAKKEPQKGKEAMDIEIQSDPPTSPIEDPSVIEPAPWVKRRNQAITSEPSKMLLEVKERVARHTAAKKANRPIKLAQQATTNSVAAAASADESSVIYISSSPSSRASSPEPTSRKKIEKANQSSSSVGETTKRDKASTKGKGKKEKPKPITPVDFAQQLQDGKLDGKYQRKGSNNKFLEDYTIFYTGGDMRYASETTRNRMELIIRYGGNLAPTFDPAVVTHIITDAGYKPTLHALGLKRLTDIPESIPTVKWTWVTSGISRANYLTKDEMHQKLQADLWQHAAFSARLEAGMDVTKSFIQGSAKGKGKAKLPAEGGPSRISDFTTEQIQDPASEGANAEVNEAAEGMGDPSRSGMLPSPPSSPHPPRPGEASSSRIKLSADPLAEFYEQARAERTKEDTRFDSGSESDVDMEPVQYPKAQKRGWTCDSKNAQPTTCANQDVIEKLSELMELHKAKIGDEDHWRAFSYSKAIRALRSYPRRIRSFEEALVIRGIGDKTARKIAEILETGDLRRIEYERTDDVQAVRVFQGIYGVGGSTAYKWYSAGCRTLDDIKKGEGGVRLSPAQEIGLQFYDDINDRMPRNEAKAIYELIKPIALSVDPKLFIEIMGSYRRGKATCGDIDILITRSPDDGRTHAGILTRLLRELHAAGIITEDLALPEDPNDLEAIYRGLCRLPDVANSRRRRIDFLTVPWESRGAALLYYTGDDIFNRAMRLKANTLGYSLNQRGLFGGVVRDPHDRRIKISGGQIVASETEKEIFAILKVPWQEPHERVRG